MNLFFAFIYLFGLEWFVVNYQYNEACSIIFYSSTYFWIGLIIVNTNTTIRLICLIINDAYF